MFRVIGVDPGTSVAGWGVLEKNGGDARYVKSGKITLDSSLKIPNRLHSLFENLKKVIEQQRPTALAVETAFYSKNIQSTMRLGEARGVILLCSELSGIKAYEYTPAKIKLSVTGNGNASKEQIQSMVRRLLRIPDIIKGDEADALAIALCHVYANRLDGFIKR
ncbi:MAG TPA: crossover junction endodeoxyribonuclease RuvC [bacterium]